ncbi:MAG: BMP family lipoprotein [Pseudobdellovibrionaceae bacterium]
MFKYFISLIILCLANILWAQPLKVALVLDKGGKDDKSFNSAAYLGATKAQKDLGIELKYVEATDVNALESLHRSFAKKNYNLIIGIGFAQADAVKKVSAQNPQAKFAIIDAEIKAPNVRSILFADHEGSFLVGALAALKSPQNTIGFIGGMDIPLIRRFALGYSAGAKYINPKIKIIENFIGVTGDSWNNPAKAKELALNQYNQNVDAIFVAAGASGAGVFDAAENKKKLAIGVDSNQNWIKPGFILTSMLKRVDIAVYESIKQANENKFKAEVVHLGLADKGIDYAMDEHNKNLISAQQIQKIEKIKYDIIAKKIIVPDFYKK